ncbi:MAG: DUF2628 domain-containing protein [Hyphomicrobiales bacterium]
MIAYTVHEPERLPGKLEERADRLRLVKEGFSWPALFVPVLWLLYHRMWLALIGFVAVLVLAEMGLSALGAGDAVGGWAGILIGLLFALNANDLRRWTLGRRGYRMTGAVVGRDTTECEYKLFAAWERETPVPRSPPEGRAAPVPAKSAGEGPVIGFLDDPLR